MADERGDPNSPVLFEMDESDESEIRRRADFLAQTAQIPFTELQRYFAAGCLVKVDDDLDLIEVAVQLARDNAAQFEQWMQSDRIAGVSDEQAALWLTQDRVLWAVVANPWVLVQERNSGAGAPG